MKTISSAGFGLIACLLVFGSIRAQEGSQKHPGMELYTPTKLEWLAVELNAEGRQDFTDMNSVGVTFIPIETDDAVLISVYHGPGVDRRLINIAVDTARKLIETKAKSRSWGWVNIKEKVSLINRETRTN